MPLRLVNDTDAGRVGLVLRRYRAEHNLLGTGQCRRLSTILAAELQDNGTAAMVHWDMVVWLSSSTLVLAEPVKAYHLARYMVGVTWRP